MLSDFADLTWSELCERACRERDKVAAERDAARREVERLEAENTHCRLIEAVARDYLGVMTESIAEPWNSQRREAARQRLFAVLDSEDD